MSRRYRSEPVEVSRGVEGAPEGFRWRGRRYVVCAVVAQWVEALPWWTGASGQRHVWRVEAASRTGTVGVYDLHRTKRTVSGARERWVMGRVLD